VPGSLTPDPEALAALREAWTQVQAMAQGEEAPTSPPEPDTSAEEETGPEADAVAVAREIALRRLSVRARSRKELAQDLAKRDVPPEAAAQVLDRFTEVGLIDDAAFAAQWVESRGSRSGASRLKQELRQKGIADEHIADAVGARDDDDDLTAARALAQRKAAAMGRLDRTVRERRLGALLERRGFSTAVIRRVLSEVRDPVDGVGN
jgi:regulatory protein